MRAIEQHLSLGSTRFQCERVGDSETVVVPVHCSAGPPASPHDLARLRAASPREYVHLAALYRKWNGIVFHRGGRTAGLVVAPTDQIRDLNQMWGDWIDMIPEDERFDYQRDGLAFAEIAGSGNYFICYQGSVYFSDHGEPNDDVWGSTIEDFFERALASPAEFLRRAGLSTRYRDKESGTQLVPRAFLHD